MKNMLKRGWRPLIAILIFIGFWQLVTIVFDIEDWILPAPTDIVLEGRDVLPDFLPHFYATLTLSVSGLLIGATIGLVIAALLHLLPRVRETFYPFLILSQNVPTIVLAPLLVIWFGFGSLPKLIVITLACFFPVAVSAIGGFQQTNRELLHYMKMMGASKSQLFWKLELPHALPAIFSGLKIAGTYSVMAAVISEWLGAQEGIGVFMTLATSSYRTPRVFVAIIVVMLLSLAIFGLIILLERLLIRWQKKGEQR
ncbi:ABC-type nitrate/sulfonate/bicarbonate transport system permease component [Virgibacillus natechei]|uniref:ABC-type nitrate/sulfonate/bicarbonate transport system permease component n=1 Tax=Virgibacillus natechei TaxID=1216297 RepID=A0ABS4IKL2_9BACI|nr:ABC transporter permease [Virgibacillus natechei]MBP1971508.1 ABC-type nitrate/sulfonate/bicarbonate transport system permease component [Virgibacillus natechei]UZD12555.1 ABC transporter permease [Virgibacillus natechei]